MEILPGTWEYECRLASVVAKTEEFAGRPSHWNGKLYDQPERSPASSRPTAA